MTSRERLTRIFQNKETDRPALKLWGLHPGIKPLHRDYLPVIEKALRLTDLFVEASSPFDLLAGRNRDEQIEDRPTDSPLWIDRVTTLHTPKGSLRSVHRLSTVGEPGYCIEYPVRQPRDIDKLLSIPYRPFPLSMDRYLKAVADVGDRGVAAFHLAHAAYGLQDLCGSENIAYLKADAPDLVNEIIGVFAKRVAEHAKAVLSAGYKPIFYWYGPELFIPPLMSPTDFEQYVFHYDKPLCDLIHNGGGHIWVHCHGKVTQFVPRFIEMGADVLNPLEPPSKNGDADLEALVARYGNQIGWEGNIEMQALQEGNKESVCADINACVDAGAKSGRFVLCHSSGFMEYPNPTAQYIDNLLQYLDYGHQKVCSL